MLTKMSIFKYDSYSSTFYFEITYCIENRLIDVPENIKSHLVTAIVSSSSAVFGFVQPSYFVFSTGSSILLIFITMISTAYSIMF